MDWRAGRGEGAPVRVMALFGVGLIGRSIADAVARRAGANARPLPFGWANLGELAVQSRTVEEGLAAAGEGGAPEAVDIVWAAGRSGFASGEAELAAEEAALGEVLELSARMVARLPRARHRFHLVSSAGGLFEGQRHVDRHSRPAPLRPYGFSKLRQEQALSSLPPGVATIVHRPGSVYGHGGAGARAGLVATLIDNAVRNRPSRLHGAPDTLRDYVLVDDVGAFIAGEVMADVTGEATRPAVHLIASGRPTALGELVTLVERIVGHRLQRRYEASGANSLDNSYRPSSLAPGLRRTSLETGVALTAMRLRQGFAEEGWGFRRPQKGTSTAAATATASSE